MYSITAAHNENTDTVMASTMCAIRNTNKVAKPGPFSQVIVTALRGALVQT